MPTGSLVCLLVLCAASGAQPAASQDAAALAAVMELASAARRAGEARKALPLWEQAAALAEQGGETGTLGRALVGLGWARWATGQYDAARDTHERALALFRRLNDAAGEAEALLRLGETLFSMGRYAEALARYGDALAANRRAPDRLREASIRSNQGSALRFLGRYGDAVESLDAAYAIFENLGDDPGMAQTLTFLGIVNRARSEYSKAIDAYTAAIALRRKTGDRRGESQALGNLGNVYRDLGQFERAIDAYTRSASIAQEIGYAAQIGFSHQSLGGLLAQLGRGDEGLARFEQALAIWRTIDRKPQVGWTLREIGIQRLYARKDPAGARAAFEEALAIGREIGEAEMVAYVTFDLGDVAVRSGAAQEGLAHFGEALAAARRIGSPNLEYEVLAERGRALLQMNRADEGIADLRASAAIVNDLRARVTSDSSKISFLDTRRRVFDDLVSALVGAGRPAEALEAAEASRARAFADLLHARQLRIRPAEQPVLEEVRAAVAASARGAPAADSRGGGVGSALDRMRSRNAELASLVAVESPGADEIRATARRLGATIIEYFVTGAAVFAWVIAPDGEVQAARLGAAGDRLDALVQATIQALDEADAAELRAGRGPRAALRELHEALVAPLARWLPARAELVIIPHGPLAYVPFAALEDATGAPLVARHALALAPSAGVFRYTAGKRRERATGARAWVFSAPDAPEDSDLPALAGALEEGRSVAARLEAFAPTHLAGAHASERAAKDQVGGATFVHFATHGLVSETRPLDSSLVLAAGGGEDGYLRVSEVFALELQASLVVLSGCSTGRGRLTGDGIFGLTRAFMYAGTPSVVVSLWDVSDRATAFLMDRFYAELTRTGDKAGALQAAQLATRERFPHPALWAPFILVGEPR